MFMTGSQLIQFLGAMVQPNMGSNSLKRKLKPSLSMIQLAIEEENGSAKEPKIEYPVEAPVIQEVTEAEEVTRQPVPALFQSYPAPAPAPVPVTVPVYTAPAPLYPVGTTVTVQVEPESQYRYVRHLIFVDL